MFVTLLRPGGSPGPRYAADAIAVDRARQHWRSRPLPRLAGPARLRISTSPLRTDSGYLVFEVRVAPR